MLDCETLKISIIVPIFNEENYVDECISSIVKQSYKNIEIILIDDGSTDRTLDICYAWKARDERIIVHSKENEGQLRARKDGIEYATGNYIMFVDADDKIDVDFCQAYLKYMLCDADMIATSNYYRYYSNGKCTKAFEHYEDRCWEASQFETEVFPLYIKTNVFFDTVFPTSMCLYAFKANFVKSIVKWWNDKINFLEDYAFITLAMLKAQSFAVIPYRGYYYRCNSNSTSWRARNLREKIINMYERVDELLLESSYDYKSWKKKNDIIFTHSFFCLDYSTLLEVSNKYLYPYSKVIAGSKLIIYGAGITGINMYRAINDKGGYTVVAIADRNITNIQGEAIKVIKPDDILKYDFDYVVIAITYANVVAEVQQSLEQLGIPLEKIAIPNVEVMDEDVVQQIKKAMR